VKPATHIGRTIDLSYPSNRWAVGLTLVGAVAGLIHPEARNPLWAAFQSGGTVLLTWALTRELDPDRPATSVVAAVAAGVVTIWTGDASLIALGGLVAMARILTRSTGSWPLLTDLVIIGAGVGIFARSPLTWATGLAVAAAVALDATMAHPAPRYHVWLAAAIGVAVTLSVVISHALPRFWSPPDTPTVIIAILGTLAGLLTPVLPLSSFSDFRNTRLDPSRLRAARRLAVASLALGVIAGGAAGGATSWPAWLALVVVGVFRVFISETTR
jgi:hypothetical protein